MQTFFAEMMEDTKGSNNEGLLGREHTEPRIPTTGPDPLYHTGSAPNGRHSKNRFQENRQAYPAASRKKPGSKFHFARREARGA